MAGLEKKKKSAPFPTPTEIRFPDRPARNQLLYRLRYPAHNRYNQTKFNVLQTSCGILSEKFATTAAFHPL
jgi:hypothetical protein